MKKGLLGACVLLASILLSGSHTYAFTYSDEASDVNDATENIIIADTDWEEENTETASISDSVSNLDEETPAIAVSDISVFYVCDEFLENGSSGGTIDCIREDECQITDNNDTEKNPNSIITDEDVPDKAVPSLRMSDEGINMLTGFEGLRPTAYKALETETYYTIGYGHYGPDVYPGMTITREQAVALLRQDLASRENHLNRFLTSNNILMRQCEFDAIVSLIYNIGTGNFDTSTIRRYILEGFDVHTDADFVYAISMWNKSGGKVIQGLVNRRAKESAHFTRYGVKRPSYSNITIGLNGNVGLNLYMDIPDSITSNGNARVEIVSGNEVSSKSLNTLSRDYSFYRAENYFSAKDVGRTVRFTLYDGSGYVIPVKNANDGVGYSFVYSVDQVARDAGSIGNSKLSSLASSLNIYGSCAKSYFEGSPYSVPSNVVNVNSSIFNSYRGDISGSAAGIRYAGSSLILKSETGIRHYFRVDPGVNINDYQFKIWDDSQGGWRGLTPEYKDGMYYVAITNISPLSYDVMYMVTVNRKGTSDQISVRYGIFSYAEKASSADYTENSLKNLMKAMYLYNQSARQYFW